MNTPNRSLRIVKATMLAVVALAFAWVAPASAQTHPTSNTWTSEGTVIKNKATANYTDARDNTYSAVESNEVSVTVGFKGSVDVTAASTSTVDFDAGTSGSAAFTVTNYGNGLDTLKFTFTNSNGTAFTNVKLCVPGTPDPICYSSVAALNSAKLVLAAAGTMVVTVTFDVASGSGNAGSTVSLGASSGRDATDAGYTDATPLHVNFTGTVGVTAGSGGAASNVPTGTGAPYSASFTVDNNTSGNDTFDVGASISGDADITIVRTALCSATGTAISSVSISAGGSASVCVLYTIAGTATASDAATITLGATSHIASAISDGSSFDITVIRPSISLSKKVYTDAGITEITTETPKPGDSIWYKIEVTNSGTADASAVTIEDTLPGEVTYVSTTGDAAGWDFTGTDGSTGYVKATLSSLAPSTPRSFLIKVTIK